MSDNYINLRFFDDIDADELEALTAAIDTIQDGGTITIELANGGGSAFHGIACADVIEHARETKNIHFECKVWGFACSAASLVALSCDKVSMSRNASIMYHSAWGAGGRQSDGVKMANLAQLSILSKRINNLSSDDFDGTDHWLDANEALDFGIIDEIIGNQRAVRPTVKIAASLFYGGHDMENEEKKTECTAEDLSQDENRQEAPAAADVVDLVEKIVERLDEIEHRLAVLEGEGKKADDEGGEVGARVSALYARLLKPAKLQNVKGSADDLKADLKADLDEFNARIKLSDYIR